MRPPPRGKFNDTVAVLDASVPALFTPLAWACGPIVGTAMTVIAELRGTLAHCTNIGTGLAICAARTTSGDVTSPFGLPGIL